MANQLIINNETKVFHQTVGCLIYIYNWATINIYYYRYFNVVVFTEICMSTRYNHNVWLFIIRHFFHFFREWQDICPSICFFHTYVIILIIEKLCDWKLSFYSNFSIIIFLNYSTFIFVMKFNFIRIKMLEAFYIKSTKLKWEIVWVL